MTVVLAKRSISPDTALRCERPPPPGHKCLPVIHISASEGGGQPEGRALSSLAFQRQGNGNQTLPSPERAADFSPAGHPCGVLRISMTPGLRLKPQAVQSPPSGLPPSLRYRDVYKRVH